MKEGINMRKRLLPYVLLLAMAISLVAIMPMTALAVDSISIYVDSTNGNDANDGHSAITAVKTLGKAFQLVDSTGQSYDIVMANGDYASPGLVNIPAGASVSVTTANIDGNVKIYKNPDTLTTNSLFEFRDSSFSYLFFNNINFTGDNPATTEIIEKSGDGVYLYSSDNISGNTIEFKNSVFDNLESGIRQEYSEYLSVIVRDSHISAKHPISMDYGRKLTVENSVLEMSEGEYWNSVIELGGGPIAVQITNNTLIGNDGAGRGIYEDVYSGTISGNTFKDLDIAIEADVHSVIISDNIIETSKDGMDLEVDELYGNPADNATGSISVQNNTIVNKGLKGSGEEGIRIYNDDDDITAASFIIQDNKIINFDTGLYYYDDHSSGISFILGGAGHGNSFWGNVINIYWDPYWTDDTLTKVDAQGNDWGTTDPLEVSDRIYADGVAPSSIFIFDETLTSNMIETAYVDSDYTTADAGGHQFGVDAFVEIMDALPYVASGGQILVNDGSYIAPVWIDRPVHIKGISDSVNLTRHASLTGYGNVTTTITAPGVTLEKLNFRNGDMGIKFDQFSKYAYSSYPDSYKILDCSFTDFVQTAIYEPGYTVYGYETVLGSTTEIRNNIITRTTDTPNGHGLYLVNQSENLYFSNNTLSGDYNYGVSLVGQNIYATGNSITVYSTYNEQALSITNTKNLEFTDNVISNSATDANQLGNAGLFLTFNDTAGSSSKEIYRNHIHGFSSGAMLFGSEISEIYDITIGGNNSNANDFSGNEFGLTSLLSNFDSEPTNATYNIWGRADDLLSGYIKGRHYSSDYQPVTYLPTASITLSDDATISGLSASGALLTPAFNSTTTSYSANVPNSVSNTTITVVPNDDGATVKINGTGATSQAVALNVGSNVITVEVIAEDGVATKTYTITIHRAATDGSSGGGFYTPPTIVVTTDTSSGNTTNRITVDPDASSGIASVSITNAMVNALLEKAEETAGTGKGDLIQVKIETTADTNKLIFSAPQSELARIASKTAGNFGISSPFLSIVFDERAVDAISEAKSGGTVSIKAAKIGDMNGRPVYDFVVMNGSTQVSDFKGGHATVTIPYELKPGEAPNAVVIYYLADDGTLKAVRGHYDASLKAVVFKTSHFSSFVIDYNMVSFNDVAADAWYKNAVDFIAARDITSGTGNNMFSPESKLTRAQFVVLLMNAYQINTDNQEAVYQIENFSDAGNTYYTDYLLAAKAHGIVNGIGNNLFAPEEEITRQEMFVMLYNALKVIDEIPAYVNNTQLSSFNDADKIASWANESLSALVKTGTVGGNNNNLYPTVTTTRAEIAQVLYNLLSK